MYPVKLICDNRFRQKHDGHPIGVQYCYSSDEKTVCKTEIYIPIGYWNRKYKRISDKLPAEYGDFNALNRKLSDLTRLVIDLIEIAKERKIHPLQFVKDTFRPDLDIKTLDEEYLDHKQKTIPADSNGLNLDFFYQIDQYIAAKKRTVSQEMPRIFRNMKYHLKAFEGFRGNPITFTCLDLQFYEELVEFLMFDYIQPRSKKVGLRINTIGKTIRLFRTFLKNRISRKIISEIDRSEWTMISEETDSIYFTWEEISKIYNLDLSKTPNLIPYRNDLVFSCLTGLRFSDFSTIDELDLREDFLYKKQQKTKNPVVIPLRPEALKLLKQRFADGNPEIKNPVYNRNVKRIVRLAGITQKIKHSYTILGKMVYDVRSKCDWTTSHTGRRTFCTLEYLAGTPVELIMKISGHKTLKAFYAYIKITEHEAAIRMQNIWKARGQLLTTPSQEQSLHMAGES